MCGLSQYSFDELETDSRIKEGKLTVEQRKKEWFLNGDIDEAFVKSAYSSDEDPNGNSSPDSKYRTSSFTINSRKSEEPTNDTTKGKRKKSFKIQLESDEESFEHYSHIDTSSMNCSSINSSNKANDRKTININFADSTFKVLD